MHKIFLPDHEGSSAGEAEVRGLRGRVGWGGRGDGSDGTGRGGWGGWGDGRGACSPKGTRKGEGEGGE